MYQRIDTILQDHLIVPGLVGPNEAHKNVGVFLKQMVHDLTVFKHENNDRLLAQDRRLNSAQENQVFYRQGVEKDFEELRETISGVKQFLVQ